MLKDLDLLHPAVKPAGVRHLKKGKKTPQKLLG
jgi:hypothetical protein